MPSRRGVGEFKLDSREILVALHHVVGIVATGLFIAACISGFIRPTNNEELRDKAMVAHTLCGHGTVLFGSNNHY